MDHEIKLTLTFVHEPPVDAAALAGRVQREPQRFRLLPSGRLQITLDAATELVPMELLRAVREAVGELPILAGRG